MQLFTFLIFALIIAVCVFGYMTYRSNAEKRAREKKRNQYNDRV